MLSTDIRLLKFLSLQTFYWLKGVPDEPVQFLLEGQPIRNMLALLVFATGLVIGRKMYLMNLSSFSLKDNQ